MLNAYAAGNAFLLVDNRSGRKLVENFQALELRMNFGALSVEVGCAVFLAELIEIDGVCTS